MYLSRKIRKKDFPNEADGAILKEKSKTDEMFGEELLMKEIKEKGYAKLNLSIDVMGVRDDGYHEMCMVMQSVTLHDDVTITLTDDGQFTGESNRGFIPNDQRNVAVKAAMCFAKAYDMQGQGVHIKLHKRNPVCAGLGGGSTDAAAVLRGLNTLMGKPFTLKQLEEIATQVGSDVAFCVAGGTQLATNRGEVMTRLPYFGDHPVVICKPYFSISTPELFKQIDARKNKCRPDTDGIIQALEEGNTSGVICRMYNVFEDVLGRRTKGINEIKRALMNHGALGACMSGTGSAVFGIFPDEKTAKDAYYALRKRHQEVFLCKTCDRIPE